jgi:hypothetical protein
MTDHSGVDDVASGAPYRVTSINGAEPRGLASISTDDVVVITAALGRQEVTIHGAAHSDGNGVVIHEKTADGTGKDVRTWRLVETGAGLEAVERSMY